ncbi:hypothetical protein HY68_36275 [Streptomyces sp. AcH 505]|uniref:HNH endonuclease family protein n=1 Tax=Streptomyces sp. AcH 505 TaxID=352211 RepID=UPI00059228B1|nr:hypothetical protein HY68_36275 [Streptomyces sp. AcH 505]
MIKTLRACVLASLTVLPLLTALPAHAAEMPLAEGIRALPFAAESRAGYERTKFKHWVDEDRDGCSTRAEVLIEESRTKPVVEAGCKVVSGTWFSYYDQQTITTPSALDIDHMVPLAEAWDSGASGWTAQRREAYANDLGSSRSLVAVTAKTNRSKSDQDPAEWMPPSAEAHCAYLADWVSTKFRWGLSVDMAERDALTGQAEGCGSTTIDTSAI